MTFLSRLFHLWRDRPDPYAVMQTPVQKFTGYDYNKARAGFQRSQRQSETGRLLPKPKVSRGPARVLPMWRAK